MRRRSTHLGNTNCRAETPPSGRCPGLKWIASVRRFEALNPWRGVPFLKLEKENFGTDGERRQLYAYCISAKLYCLFNLDGNRLLVRNPSGHGLGFLQAPYSIDDWEKKDRAEMDRETCRLGSSRRGILSFRESWVFLTKPPRWLKQTCGHGGAAHDTSSACSGSVVSRMNSARSPS